MEINMIIDKIINFIGQCPFLDEMAPIKADYCNEDAISYCVETSAKAKEIETYVDGSQVLQLSFAFSSKEVMSDYDDINVENTVFYEKFSDWVEEQNNARNLPKLEGNLSSISVKTVSHGYVVQSEADRGRYQIQMVLKYLKKV